MTSKVNIVKSLLLVTEAVPKCVNPARGNEDHTWTSGQPAKTSAGGTKTYAIELRLQGLPLQLMLHSFLAQANLTYCEVRLRKGIIELHWHPFEVEVQA